MRARSEESISEKIQICPRFRIFSDLSSAMYLHLTLLNSFHHFTQFIYVVCPGKSEPGILDSGKNFWQFFSDLSSAVYLHLTLPNSFHHFTQWHLLDGIQLCANYKDISFLFSVAVVEVCMCMMVRLDSWQYPKGFLEIFSLKNHACFLLELQLYYYRIQQTVLYGSSLLKKGYIFS